MLRNALGTHVARGAAIAATALVIAGAIAPLAAQQAPPAAPASRPGARVPARATPAPSPFSLEQMLSYPYIEELVTSPTQPRLAWVTVRAGVRNVWAASGPDYAAHQLTDYRSDDGQELTNLSISGDGKFVVFVRGGDHDANWDPEGGVQPNPSHSPTQPKVQVWAVALDNGGAPSAPKLLADGDQPVLSPRGDRVVFLKDNQLSIVPTDGSAPAKSLRVRARHEQLARVVTQWRPARVRHRIAGITASLASSRRTPRPSAFLRPRPRTMPRRHGRSMASASRSFAIPVPVVHRRRCSICIPIPGRSGSPTRSTGEGHVTWQSPNTLRGSFPGTQGEANLAWGAGNRLIFLSDMDGWPHLYSIPATGGAPLLLTPGAFMAEYVTMTPDHSAIVYNANTGTTPGDYDRRHLFRVPVDRAAPAALTSGEGLEWSPRITGDGRTVAFIGATAQRPPLPMITPLAGGAARALATELIPPSFPVASLVIPKPVTFKAADGTEVHGQLFARDDKLAPGALKKPGIIFVHGGPPRQMLLGWHYMNYYSNAYAVNQYLANHGYVVLAVNYRLGIGYGHDFNNPPHSGPWGASEYQDVQAGAEYLRTLADVNASKIGIWGGSYGGYLTALALARNSDVFKAGVDLHGVHNWIADIGAELTNQQLRYEKADIKQALDVAWQSSPVASMATWKSPVLLIQGDDDRNVHFHETVDLARRLGEHHIPYEELVFPDEIHGFLRYATWLAADRATIDYFDRQFLGTSTQTR